MNQHEPRRSSLVVALARSDDERFTCTLPDWNFIGELGRTFGWHPAGTTYLPQRGQRARNNPIKHDYQPGDTEDGKRIEANDSAQWAAALDVAQRSPFISRMLQTRTSGVDQNVDGTSALLHSQVQDFIRFARRGAFTLALRDGEKLPDQQQISNTAAHEAV